MTEHSVPGDGVDDLVVERDAGVLTLTLDRPHARNALTPAMVQGITAAVEDAAVDDETRCVVLRTSGDHFCAGADIAAPNRREGERSKPRMGHLQRNLHANPHRMIRSIDEAQVPVVSVVRGFAAGLGNALAICADFVVADSTSVFWVPFVTKGFAPDSGNSWLLPRLIGTRRAKEMILRGTKVEGPLAAEWGLITECVDEDQLDAAATALVSELAASATVPFGLSKLLIGRNANETLADAMHNESVYEELAVRSDDFKEGMRSFAEKRPPEYTGW